MTSVHVTLWQTNNSIHFLTWGLPVNHGGRDNMELRHLQVLTSIHQSTGNRRCGRLDIWWRRNESFLLLPCQGKCPKSKRVKLTFVYLFVCLLTKRYCEHGVLTHSPSGVFRLVEQIIWVLTKEKYRLRLSGNVFTKTPRKERCLFGFFSRSYIGLIL